MPDHTIRILSTRPLDTSLINEAAAQGIVLDIRSFIETRPIAGEALSKRISELSGNSLTAIFTSMNAAEAVAGLLRAETGSTPSGSLTPLARILPWKIFCLGYATRALVREYFGEETLAEISGSTTQFDSAGALADFIIRQGDIREVFFFCGDQRREELPERLEQHGIRVNEITVYKTVQIPQKTDRSYNGIVFFSPSAVHSFFTANPLPAETTLMFAIGQTTAAAIRNYCTNQIITSLSPEKTALIRQAIDYFKSLMHL
jgi:uroporphyrinogen-III synthase